VNGDVVVVPTAVSIEDVETSVAVASEWVHTEEPYSRLHTAMSVAERIPLCEWGPWATEVEAVARRHAPAMTHSGPLWESVVTSLLAGLIKAGVTTLEAFHEEYTSYRDLVSHLSGDGDVQELLNTVVPEWMSYPVNLAR